MMLSLTVTVALMLLVVGATGLCTINPENSQRAAVRDVDAQSFLELEARASDAAIREPQLPEGWQSNSARRASVAGTPASVVGWITPSEGFVEAWQTIAPADAALNQFDDNFRDQQETRTLDGTEVTVKTSSDRGVRDIWVADLGDARVIVTGSSSDEDFATLMQAFIDAEPITPGA